MRSTTFFSRAGQSMARNTGVARAAVLACGLAAGLAQAAPVVIFTATDIDGAAGDQWRYDFSLSGTADAGESVNLLFDSGLYAGLASANPTSNLMLADTQPDPGLPAAGQVTATFIDALSAAQSFAVEFTWLGGIASPGSQPYEYLDGGFTVIGGGRTRGPGTPTVPEPQMLSALLALAGVATWVRRRKTASRG